MGHEAAQADARGTREAGFSCKVANALSGLSSRRMFTNTWFDGWTLY